MMRDESDISKQPGDQLCPKSQAALDALIDAGFDLSKVPGPDQERCRAAAKLLGLLGESEPATSTVDDLCRATMQRVLASQAVVDHRAEDERLCPEDDDALEALVGAKLDPRHVAGGMRARAANQVQLLGLLDLSAESRAELDASRDQLISATLVRVQQSIGIEEARMRLEPAEMGTRRFRIADFASLAAMLLIGTAVIWPTLGFAREKARQTACLSNLGAVGQALGLYGSGNRDALPMATASIAGVPWWNVGRKEESNSANYYTLKHQKYVGLEQMACGGNPTARRTCEDDQARDWRCFEEVSYSFQNLFASKRPTLVQAQVFAVAVDRSPVVARARRGDRVVYAQENSFHHGGRGQNILMSDGRVQWATTPILASGDNIWLPSKIEQLLKLAENYARTGVCQPLKGVEEPDGPEDSFLCP